MIREYCHADPARMTWSTYDDCIFRLVPYLVKVRHQKMDDAAIEVLRLPLILPKATP